MERIKVLFDHSIFTRQEVGGVSRYFIKLITELKELNIDPCVLAPFHANSMLRSLKADVVKGVDFNNPSFYTYKAPFFFINPAINRLQSVFYRGDVYHETYYSSHSNLGTNRPVVITVHDFVHERFPNLFPKSDNTVVLKKRAIQRADHIICISENTKRDLQAFYDVHDKPITVIHHGIDKPMGLIDSARIIEKPYFLYVGSRSAYKNFNTLVKAFGKNGDIKKEAMLVAFGGGQFTLEERNLFNELGLNDQVLQISGDDQLLASAYKHAVALVYPSLYEGFGFPPLEAMTYGCPPIVSEASCLPEVVGRAGLFFDPNNEQDLSDKLSILFYDGAFRQKLVELGKENVSRFSWKKTAKATAEVYRTLSTFV